MSGDEKTIKILFFGDMVGKPGRYAVRDYIDELRKNDEMPDFIIANVENASHGFGLTEKNYNEISGYGVDCMTSGNHIWDKKDIFNYPAGTPGVGSRIFEIQNGLKIAVVNALGRVFMAPVDSVWECVRDEIKRLKEITPIIIVDFHAEATAEKICFGRFCSELGVSAFFGTHTHVQTADEQIFNNMAYITDAGFSGTSDGVIGMEYSTSLSRFTTVIPDRYDVAEGDITQVCAVEVELNPSTGYAVAIKRVFCSKNRKEKDERP